MYVSEHCAAGQRELPSEISKVIRFSSVLFYSTVDDDDDDDDVVVRAELEELVIRVEGHTRFLEFF